MRLAALAVAAVVALGLGGLMLKRLFEGALPASMDFAAFWTAGKIGVEGGNVYDGAAVRDVQRNLGLNDTAIMMWNPPWALTFVLPLGWFSFQTAYGIWVLFNIGFMLASAELLWRGLGGTIPTRGLAYLFTLTFASTLLLIFNGQLTTLVLFGLAGFLALRQRHPYFAGAVGAITAIKPHMLVLFALWLLFDALRNRDGRKVLLGGLAALLLMSIPPMLANPHVWSQYAAITTGGSSADHQHVSSWAPPLIGWWLRMAVPGQPFWVQWLPLLIGIAVFIGCSLSRRLVSGSAAVPAASRTSPQASECPGNVSNGLNRGRDARGPGIVPLLVGVSLLIAPYGVWHHDLVLLLLPILATAVKLIEKPSRSAIAFGVVCFVLTDAVMFAMIVAKSPYEWFVWVVPAVLLGCAATLRIAERVCALAPGPLGA